MTERHGANVPRTTSNRHVSDRKSKIGTRHYEMSPTGTFSKLVDKNEGLSFLPGDQWKDLTDSPWQYHSGSPLEYGSQFTKVDSFPLSEKSSQIELEWQWIMNQQQSPKAESFSLSKRRECFEDDNSDDKDDAKEGDTQAQNEASTTTSSLLTGSNSEGSSDAETSKSSRNSTNLSTELERDTLKPSSIKDVEKSFSRVDIEWHRAATKDLAELVSRKGHCYLENCDLPPSQSSYTWRGPLVSSDLSHSIHAKSCGFPSAEKVLVSAVSSGRESTPGVRRILDPVSTIVPSGNSSPNSSCDTNWKTSPKRSKETLGEALCHSQTRARQGEKLAAQALQEKEKLLELLFKEARTTRTYKHWVQTLELENKLLKACSGLDESGNKKKLNGFEHVEDRGAWKRGRKRAPYRKRLHESKGDNAWGWSPENNALVRCTIGLAFALGLSFAGAGLMIGWSMGWILLSN